MTAELPGQPGDAAPPQPDVQADSGQGSPPPEPTFDVDGQQVSASELVTTQRRYKELEKEFTKRSQKLAEYEAALGEYGVLETGAPGAGAPPPQQPTQNPAYGYPPRQAAPYTPPPEAPADDGYYPQSPAAPPVDALQELRQRQDAIEAGMEVVAFANQNRWMSEDQMRQVVALRDGLENRYQQTVPLELALDRWLVESSKRVQAQNAAEESRKQALETAEQARLEAVRSQQAAATGQPPVMPGSGGEPSESGPPPASWEEIERKYLPTVAEIARQEGIVE